MASSDKEFLYNKSEKPPVGGSHHLTVDPEGRVFSVYTPYDPQLNVTSKEISDPGSDLVAELTSKREAALGMLQKVVIDPENAEKELRSAADVVWLEDNGIDPESIR